MNKYVIKLITLVFIGVFAISPNAFAQDLSLSDVIQNKITERRENIRAKLGTVSSTPLSPDALVIVDQIIQKFTYASAYMSDMNDYLQALQDTVDPEANVKEQLQYANAEHDLEQIIVDMNAYRANATQETVAEFSVLVQKAKDVIALLSQLQLGQIETLRAAKISSELLTFDACAVGPIKEGFAYTVDAQADSITIQLQQKADCQTAKSGTFTTAQLTTLADVALVSSSLTTNADNTLTATLPLGDVAKPLASYFVVQISAVNDTDNSFVIPVFVKQAPLVQ